MNIFKTIFTHLRGHKGELNFEEFKAFRDMLTVSDLQEALNVSRSTAYDLVNSGDLPVYRFGTAIRIRKKDLVDFLDRTRYNSLDSNERASEKEER